MISLKSGAHFEVSAKDDYNVSAVFDTVFKALTVPKRVDYQKSSESLGARVIRRLSVALGENKAGRRSSEGDKLDDRNEEPSGGFRPRVASCGTILMKTKKKIGNHGDDITCRNPRIRVNSARRKSSSFVATVDYNEVALPDDQGVDATQVDDSTRRRARRHSACVIVKCEATVKDDTSMISKNHAFKNSSEELRVRTCVEPISPKIRRSQQSRASALEPNAKISQFLKNDTQGKRVCQRSKATLEADSEISQFLRNDTQGNRLYQKRTAILQPSAEISQFLKNDRQEKSFHQRSTTTLQSDAEISQFRRTDTQESYLRRRSTTTLETDAKQCRFLNNERQERILRNHPNFTVHKKYVTCIRTHMSASNGNEDDPSGSQLILKDLNKTEQIRSITVHQQIFVQKRKDVKSCTREYRESENIQTMCNIETSSHKYEPKNLNHSAQGKRRKSSVFNPTIIKATLPAT